MTKTRISKKRNQIIIDGAVAYILMKNGAAIIDAEDVERVRGYTWCMDVTGPRAHIPGEKRKVLLARIILFGDNHDKERHLADHKDHNTFDNRKQNLRPATRGENNRNARPRAGVSSKYKGVYWHAKNKKWAVKIQVEMDSRHLGYFYKEEDAARAYNKAAKKLFKAFAFLNFLSSSISQ
jgi:hypothetical protein